MRAAGSERKSSQRSKLSGGKPRNSIRPAGQVTLVVLDADAVALFDQSKASLNPR